MAERGGAGREGLRGLGEHILVLVCRHASPLQQASWRSLPLELDRAEAESLLNLDECCKARRHGEDLLELVMERASPDQWSKWLQIPLEHACLAGNTFLVEQLLNAGARKGSASARGGGGGCGSGRSTLLPVPTDPTAANSLAFSSGSTGGQQFITPVTPASSASSDCCPPPAEGTTDPSWCCGGKSRATNSCGANPAPAADEVLPRAVEEEEFMVDAEAAELVATDPLCLHEATKARNLVLMQRLLAAGVDRNAIDLWECTALHRAAEQTCSDAEAVRVLIAAGLDVGARDMEGYSPLHFAAAKGAEDAIVHLLAAGASLTDRGANGDTPLHSAVRFLSLAAACKLLDAGADENAVNEDGASPVEVTGVLPDGRPIENQPDPLTAREIAALLADVPAWRLFQVWKRRSWLVMLRARTQARPLSGEIESKAAGASRNSCCSSDGAGDSVVCGSGIVEAKLENTLRYGPWECCGGACEDGDDAAGEDGCCEGAGPGARALFDLVTQTTELAEDGVFQTIVRFL